jgi:hypothetical protein
MGFRLCPLAPNRPRTPAASATLGGMRPKLGARWERVERAPMGRQKAPRTKCNATTKGTPPPGGQKMRSILAREGSSPEWCPKKEKEKWPQNRTTPCRRMAPGPKDAHVHT